jgi:hypothetical protein
MDTNSVGRAGEYSVPVAPQAPEPREQEQVAAPQSPAPEPPVDTGKRLDLYA